MDMDINKLSEIIATEVNLKTLEVYRMSGEVWRDRQVDEVLADLGTKIVEAIKSREAELAEPAPRNAYERWLGERREKDKRDVLVVNDLASFTTTESDNRVAPAGADEPHRNNEPEADQRQPAGQPDDPNSPAIEQDAPETATEARNQSSPAKASPIDGDDVGAGSANKEPEKKSTDDKPADGAFFQALQEWIVIEDLSNCEAARRACVSNVTIYNLSTGITKRPMKGTKDKILAAIRKDQTKRSNKPAAARKSKPKVELPPDNPAPEPEATKAVVEQERKGAGQFLAKQLQRWINAEKRSEKEICETLGINQRMIGRILGGYVPHEDTIYSMAKHLPGVAMNQAALVKLSGATHKHNGNGA